MNPVQHIRTNVFKLSQAAFAEIACVSQPTVSRWEQNAGGLEPNRDEMDNIRKAALERGLDWKDSLFFEAPPVSEPERAA